MKHLQTNAKVKPFFGYTKSIFSFGIVKRFSTQKERLSAQIRYE